MLVLVLARVRLRLRVRMLVQMQALPMAENLAKRRRWQAQQQVKQLGRQASQGAGSFSSLQPA